MNHPQLDAILRRVLAGEIDAYAEIIRFYQQDVWKVAAAMLLNHPETEDLVQQTFLAVYRHLHQFKPGADFSTWIKQIARNTVRQHLRARSRELNRLESYHRHLMTLWDDPAETLREASRAEALHDCTRQLPPESARLLDLRYQDGWDFTQIAAFLGRSVEAARQHLARIRIALRDCVQKRLAKA